MLQFYKRAIVFLTFRTSVNCFNLEKLILEAQLVCFGTLAVGPPILEYSIGEKRLILTISHLILQIVKENDRFMWLFVVFLELF